MGDLGVTNGHFSLPDKDSHDVHLVVATPEERNAQLHANSLEWRGCLPSVEAYIRREDMLANQELTKDGRLTTWLLVHAPTGNERKVLCGCETYYKKALVGKNGKMEDTVAIGIGSVFTPTGNRGKGYGGRMMKELAKRLKDVRTEDGSQVLLSVLFSDIGKQFYAAKGWHPFPSAHTSLPAVSTVADGLPPVRFLQSQDIPELCSIDETMVRARLGKSGSANKTSVALLPDIMTISWHHAREEFIGAELFGQIPSVKGAVVGDLGSRVWCYWNRVWTNPQEEQPNTLHILRIVVEDESFSDFAPASPAEVEMAEGSTTTKAVAALFAAAQSEAAKWGMKEVQIWNPTSTILAAAQLVDKNASVHHRQKESIASLQWYGEGSWEDVDWICNEKYGWC